MIVAGVDPGIHGAIAFIDTDAGTIEVTDMPYFEFTTNKKDRKRIDSYAIVNTFKTTVPDHVYMEEVWSSPQMGVVSAFSFGQGRGLFEGIMAGLELPLTMTKPTEWKKAMRVPTDKRAATQRASQLLPAAATAFRGPRGGLLDGRAEASILALYGCLDLGADISAKMELIT